MTRPHRSLVTALKLAICLIAILAILYTQAWVESFGWSYGGPLHTQIGYRQSDVLFWSSFDGSDMLDGSFWQDNSPRHYPWDTEQGWVLIPALALIVGLYLWHTLWAAPRRRERLLAAELRPMSRLVSSPPRRTKKPKRHPSRTSLWL
jgi:hypothetical protein